MILREAGDNLVVTMPLGDFAEHLRLANGFADDGTEDGLLAAYLRNATAVVERHLSQALVRRAFEIRVSRWDRDGHLVMPVGPVESLTRFEMVSASGTIDLMSSGWELSRDTARQILTGHAGASLRPIPTGYWVEVGFEAGHADEWETVPGDLRQAVMLLAAHFYEFRGGSPVSGQGLPSGIAALLEPRRSYRL